MANETTSSDSHDDRVAEQVTASVESRPTFDAPHGEIAERAREATSDLADAPVQTFTPVLAEHQVIDQMVADGSASWTGAQRTSEDMHAGAEETSDTESAPSVDEAEAQENIDTALTKGTGRD